MSDINIFKLAGILHELKSKFENVLPCIKVYEKDKLSRAQEIKLIPKIVKLLEKKYGIDKAIEEFHLIVYDIEKMISSVREDVSKKEYKDAAIQLAKGIEEMLPSVAELLPIIIPAAVDVAEGVVEDVNTDGAHLAIQGLKGALVFAENTVNATCTVLEDYHGITNITDTTATTDSHDEL